ncbi:MAG: tetratricopeptide repeat protein [Bacteroidetes bacterium]|nr:tetratricopeptide repeat protein [Bacteroidota bacterium]
MLRSFSFGIVILLLATPACRNNDGQPARDANATDTTIEALQKTLIEQPKADSTREKLVFLLLEKKQLDAAILHADTLLMHRPGNPAYLFMKADALERKGDTSNAIQSFQEAINAAGVFADASLRLANLYAENGNAEALSVCDDLLQQEGTQSMRSQILFVKGIYFVKTKQSTKALALFDQLIREDHVFMDAYIEKGLVFYDQGKYDEAHKVFTLSTEVSNAFAEGYFWMAKCEMKTGREKEAIANFKRSLALDPSIEEARAALQTLEKP